MWCTGHENWFEMSTNVVHRTRSSGARKIRPGLHGQSQGLFSQGDYPVCAESLCLHPPRLAGVVLGLESQSLSRSG